MDIGDASVDRPLNSLPGQDVKRSLPSDLPTSLDDRRSVPDQYKPETEMYDAWQGEILSDSIPS